jgi:hypothetical protein
MGSKILEMTSNWPTIFIDGWRTKFYIFASFFEFLGI